MAHEFMIYYAERRIYSRVSEYLLRSRFAQLTGQSAIDTLVLKNFLIRLPQVVCRVL